MKQALLSVILFICASAARAGLDVTAYSGLMIVESPVVSSDGTSQGKDQITLDPGNFPDRFRGLEVGKVYQFTSSF